MTVVILPTARTEPFSLQKLMLKWEWLYAWKFVGVCVFVCMCVNVCVCVCMLLTVNWASPKDHAF